MRFFLKALVVLVFLGGLALVAYAVFFDLPSPQRDIVVPVEQR
jgi:hypothetical protein